MLQFVSAPVISTVPVGTIPVPLTVTLTLTAWPGVEGSGVSAVMLVVLGTPAVDTAWLSVLQLL